MEIQLSALIQTTGGTMLRLLDSFDGQTIKMVPYEGSWTAAQVGDHLLKSYNLILRAIYGKVEKTSRDPESNVDQIKNIFLDFNVKFKSPEMIRPSDQPAEREQLLSELISSIGKLKEASDVMDLSMTALDADMPGLGKLTGTEWLYFFVYHTQRHIHQLEKISGMINKSL